MAVVATTRVEARSRRRTGPTVTAMATLAGATDTACATPCTYADALKSARGMASVAVKVTADAQSEHASHAPPSGPANPAKQ